ncbi:MAG: hypothetical protein GC134_02365 [Proteobacteria bacterium]|nr:hypothetical protein [Pseudomonadota bacterium]
MMYRFITSQRGAMFGLDARVAMAIFGIASVLVGTAVFGSMREFEYRALSKELKEMHVAIEGLHNDLQASVRSRLTTPSDANSFTALYDSSVLTAAGQQKWLGPYINLRSNTHPSYGTMSLTRAAVSNAPGTACTATDGTCYLYVVYSAVPDGIIADLDDALDNGDGATAGKVQWSVVAGQTDTLYFRTMKNIR